jgi:pilus assembly protein CpaC
MGVKASNFLLCRPEKARHFLYGLLAALVTVLISGPAHAGGDPDYDVKRDPNRASVLRIDAGGGDGSRRLVLPLNKAAIVELPQAVADVLVSSPDIVDAVVRTSTRTYLFGKAVGQSNAFFFNAAGVQILNLEIRVERDLSPLHDAFSRFLPGSKIKAEAINDNIVLSGRVNNAVQADQARDLAARFVGAPEKVLNMLAIEGKEQVLLKVRIAEMQRSLAKQLGIDLSAAIASGNFAAAIATSSPFSLLGQALSADSKSTLSYSKGNDSVGGALKALERAGLLRTLAEPNLTAISGEAAKFLAGGEFPVPASRDRDGNVSVDFKPFGVGLNFTPVVLDKGRISLKISTEVSELSNEGSFLLQGTTTTDANGNVISTSGINIPALKVRRADTTVELPSGGALMMAGLIQESTKQNLDGLPALKDLPVLGNLFRSRDFQNNETELVVIVTFYLVSSVAEQQLATPVDGFAPASEADTLLLGRLNAVYGVQGAKPEGEGVKGPVGFIME